MSEMISHSFEKYAFLGEKAKDQKFFDKINETSKKINVILNPIDSVAARQANGKAAKMVEGLKEGSEWGCDNVFSLIDASQDIQRPQNQEVARKRLEVLAYSTYIAMKHGGNTDLETAVGTMDGGVVDAKLPDSLKGLGGLVVDIAVNQEINNPQLRDVLKKLDRQANLLRAGGTVGEEKLKELIGNKILGLSELADELDDRGYEELTRVSAFLGAEADKIEDKMAINASKTLRVEELSVGENAMLEASKQMEALVDELGERGEQKNMSFSDMRAMLDYIEKSGSKSDDISLNSRLRKSLMDVALGTRKIEGLPAGINEGDTASEIRLRLALNDCYLLASASGAKTADGIDRFLAQTRADDTEHSFDRNTIKFFLCGGDKGANGIPVDVAWDLRQRAYFDYQSILNEAFKNPEIIKKHPEMLNCKVKKDENGVVISQKNEFLDLGDPIMRKNVDFGIYKDYYNNYRCDKNSTRREIVKDYMIQNIMDTKGVSREVAEKSWELAMKLSVATYTDSGANIAFIDGDDLAEVLMFKFIRYQDGVEADGKKSAKNKPVGSIETIKHINSLLPTPLAYAQREFELVDDGYGNKIDDKTRPVKRGMYMPIYSKDLDSNLIDGKSDLEYVLGPIFHKKSQEVKNAIMTDLTPKEGNNLAFIQKTFERLNKVMAETDRAGWSALNPREFNPELREKKNLKERQRLLRTWFIAGMMERATESPSLGWTRTAYYELERTLFGRKTFIDEDSKQGDVFITKEDWNWINKAYKVKSTLKIFEDDERRAKRYLFK